MPDYSKGKIYKIYSKTLNNCYYGSTVQSLNERLSKHIYEFKKQKGKCSELVLKYNDYEMILVELFPCTSKKQLLEREGYYQRNFKCVNKQIAGRTKKEWYEYHKEELKIKNKQYYENHKEEIKIKQKKYCDDHNEEIKIKRKQYYEDHKKEIKKYNNQYQEKHKEIYNEKRKIKITCCCGSVVRKSDIRRHERSEKHLKYINNLQTS